jgi:hypothetical protein
MTIIELLAAGWAAATAICVGVVVLRARHVAAPGSRPAGTAAPASDPVLPPQEAPLLPLASRELDVEREFGAAINALRSLAAENMIEFEVVLQPGLKIWSDPYALRQILIEALTHAVHRAAGGGVLLSAQWHGGRVHTTITDDGPPGDPMRLRASLRRVEECVALQGGTLEINCSAARGNVLTIRLPGVGEPACPTSDDTPMEEPTVREIPRGRVVRSAP